MTAAARQGARLPPHAQRVPGRAATANRAGRRNPVEAGERAGLHRPAAPDAARQDDGLVAAGADGDELDPGPGGLRAELDVVARVLRQVLPGLAVAEVLGPAGELLVHGLGVVEVGLQQRELVQQLAAGLVV